MSVRKKTTLPPLGPGKVHALKIYPGGRVEYHQYSTEWLINTDDALRRLHSGEAVRVRLQDATEDLLKRVPNG